MKTWWNGPTQVNRDAQVLVNRDAQVLVNRDAQVNLLYKKGVMRDALQEVRKEFL